MTDFEIDLHELVHECREKIDTHGDPQWSIAYFLGVIALRVEASSYKIRETADPPQT